MNTKPTIGQRVCLNNTGYDRLWLRSREAIKQSQNMRITDVENINAGTGSEPIWMIEVDQPLIDFFLLDSSMVDPI
jgi:hypothetical protein